MLLYRVETADGRGPYTQNWTYGDDLHDFHDPDTGCYDGIIRYGASHAIEDLNTKLTNLFGDTTYYRDDIICGCTGLNELLTWFDDDCLDMLTGEGFYIVEYEVGRYHMSQEGTGKLQAVFYRCAAVEISRMEL